MVTRLFVIRHCQSAGNISGRFQGRFDAEISETGQKQLDLLSLRFRNQAFDAVYSSPLVRARRTADAVNRFRGLPVRIEEQLSEIDVGKLENLLLPEIAERYPAVARCWDQTPELCEFPGGETMLAVYRRVNEAIDRIISENEGKTVVVATHGGVIRNLFARVEFGCPEGIRKSAVFGNTGVSLLEAEDGRLAWKLVNDLSHLPEELSRPPMRYSFQSEAV